MIYFRENSNNATSFFTRYRINWIQSMQNSSRFKLCDTIFSSLPTKNVPVTSGSWKDFDVGILLIGSKEMIQLTSFGKHSGPSTNESWSSNAVTIYLNEMMTSKNSPSMFSIWSQLYLKIYCVPITIKHFLQSQYSQHVKNQKLAANSCLKSVAKWTNLIDIFRPDWDAMDLWEKDYFYQISTFVTFYSHFLFI